jgi:glyoxylase-like metal-dependent hydrolase (beta-lactamase superfamily II)
MTRASRALRLACALACALSGPAAADPLHPRRVEVAPGIHVFETGRYGDVGLDGNSVAIIAPEGVLVFDANGTPAAAAAVLEEIRAITPAPVRFLVLSHWHWDHWYGAQAYADAFPKLAIVTAERGRTLMAGPAQEFNRPGLERDLPRYIDGLEKRASASPPPADVGVLRETLAEDRFFLDQKVHVRTTLPNLTFREAMTIHLGDREIEVLNYGRGVTPGDTFLYLPKEKVLVTGDLLVNPITFALDCYPTEWLRALERMDALEVSVLVPGHGEPLHDKAHLRATIAVLREMLRLGRAARERGETPDSARPEILEALKPLRAAITHDDPARNDAFAVQLVDWFLHRAWAELDGPLGDEIAPIPPS